MPNDAINKNSEKQFFDLHQKFLCNPADKPTNEHADND